MPRAAYSLSALVAILSFAAPSLAEAKLKLAVVDVRKAMEATSHWKKAYSKLEKERSSRQIVIEAKKKELKEKKEAFEAKKIVSDPKDIQQEEAALYREAQMFMQQFQMSQQELTYLEKQLADQMLVRIERVVNQISLEKGYDYVFEVGFDGEPNVLYSARGIDITRSVIKTYEKAYKGKPLQDPKLPQGRPGK